MAVASAEQFLDVLAACELLSDADLEKARGVANGATDPKIIARKLVNGGFLSPWQATQLLSEKLPKYFGNYSVIDLLGEGQWGLTFLAEHKQMNRRVILRTVTRRKGSDGESVQKFLEEARSLAGLDHRNLIHVYDVDKEGASYYLVMEFVEGEDLQKIVDGRGPLPPDEAAGYAAQAASGLAHAHARNIHHHGIQPDRLLIDGKGELKILDIGIARLADRDEIDVTDPENVPAGAVDYLAPEQATGKHKVDHRTDIYALGAALFCLLTGHPPFPKGNSADRLRARLVPQPPSVADDRPDTPSELVEICSKMMATQPRDRYPSAEEAARELENWIAQFRNSMPTATAAEEEDGEEDLPEFTLEVPAKAPRPGKPAKADQRDKPGIAKPKAATAEDSQAPAAAPARKKGKVSPQLIYALAAGGVALVLLVVLIVVLLTRGGPDDEVAAAAENGDAVDTADATGDAPPSKKKKKQSVPKKHVEYVPLSVINVEGPAGVGFDAIDGGYLVTGENPSSGEYAIVGQTNLDEITGFKLEVLTDDALPGKGPGRSPTGNFMLSELEVYAAPNSSFQATHRRNLTAVEADHEQVGWRAPASIDRNMGTAWGVNPQVGQPHEAIYVLDEPIKRQAVSPKEKNYWVKLVLHQKFGRQHTIGRFRILAQTGGKPAGPSDAPNVLANPTLAHWRFEDGAANQPVPNVADSPTAVAASDVSGNNNHVYAQSAADAPQLSSQVSSDVVRVTGEPNKSSLNTAAGAGGRFVSTSPTRSTPAIDVGGFKLEQWTLETSFQLADANGEQVIVAKTGQPTAAPDAPLELKVDAGKLIVKAIDSQGQLREVVSDVVVQPKHWYHVAAVSDGRLLQLLVDTGDGQGYQVRGSTPFDGALVDSHGTWTVGRGFHKGAAAGPAKALVDEVRIAATVLPPKDFLFYTTDTTTVAQNDPGAPPTSTAPSADPTPVKFHPIEVSKIEGGKGTTFTRQPDGSYLVGGTSHDKITYKIEGKTSVQQITGFRLEVMADSSLPGGGPGRHEGDPKGKFGLTNFVVEVAAAADAKKWSTAKFAKTEADHRRSDIAKAIDDDGNSGWVVGDKLGKNHWAVFKTSEPVGHAGQTFLRINLHNAIGGKSSIGRFRLSAMTGTEAGEPPGQQMLTETLKGNPFANTAASIDLPVLGDVDAIASELTDPFPLGTVYIGPNDQLQADLLGREKAHGARGEFTMQPVEVDGADEAWNIAFTAAGGAPVDVARVSVIGEDLLIGWLAKAAEITDANFLRNCALNLRIGDKQHNVALRSTEESTPIEFILAKSKKRAQPFRAELTFLPSPDALHVELKVDEEVFGKHKFEPQNTLAANKGEAAIVLGESEALRVKVQSSIKQSVIQLALRPTLKRGMAKEIPYSYSGLQAEAGRGQATYGRAAKALAEKEKIEKVKEADRKGPDKQKLALINATFQRAFRTHETAKVKEALAKMSASLEQLNELMSYGEDFTEEEAAKIEFRVYVMVGDAQVDLLKSVGWGSLP